MILLVQRYVQWWSQHAKGTECGPLWKVISDPRSRVNCHCHKQSLYIDFSLLMSLAVKQRSTGSLRWTKHVRVLYRQDQIYLFYTQYHCFLVKLFCAFALKQTSVLPDLFGRSVRNYFSVFPVGRRLTCEKILRLPWHLVMYQIELQQTHSCHPWFCFYYIFRRREWWWISTLSKPEFQTHVRFINSSTRTLWQDVSLLQSKMNGLL